MKQRTGRVTLERGAVADLWRNTLLPMPSVFGRLVYLASLRDRDSGYYEHEGLAQVFGDAEADYALRQSHSQAFSEWLCFNLEQQKADVDLYISGLPVKPRQVIDNWIRTTPYRNLIPVSASAREMELYLSDFGALLMMLRAAHGASGSE